VGRSGSSGQHWLVYRLHAIIYSGRDRWAVSRDEHHRRLCTYLSMYLPTLLRNTTPGVNLHIADGACAHWSASLDRYLFHGRGFLLFVIRRSVASVITIAISFAQSSPETGLSLDISTKRDLVRREYVHR